jgi:hypothetical protein
MIFLSFTLACYYSTLITLLQASNKSFSSYYFLKSHTRSSAHLDPLESRFKRSNRHNRIAFDETNEIAYSNDHDDNDVIRVDDIYVLISDDALKTQTIKDLNMPSQHKSFYLNRPNRHSYRLDDFLRQNVILTVSEFFSRNILCNLDEQLLLNDKKCKHLVDNRHYNSNNNGDTKNSIMTRVFARKISSRTNLIQINSLIENFKTHYRIDSKFSKNNKNLNHHHYQHIIRRRRLKSIVIISNSFFLNSFKSIFSHGDKSNVSLLGVDMQKLFYTNVAKVNVS